MESTTHEYSCRRLNKGTKKENNGDNIKVQDAGLEVFDVGILTLEKQKLNQSNFASMLDVGFFCIKFG
jgi:hypothetical protein